MDIAVGYAVHSHHNRSRCRRRHNTPKRRQTPVCIKASIVTMPSHGCKTAHNRWSNREPTHWVTTAEANVGVEGGHKCHTG